MSTLAPADRASSARSSGNSQLIAELKKSLAAATCYQALLAPACSAKDFEPGKGRRPLASELLQTWALLLQRARSVPIRKPTPAAISVACTGLSRICCAISPKFCCAASFAS